MPRLPVDGKRVIEHRITFGTKEREMFEGALGAYQINKVATPVVAGMSDVSFMITLSAILTFWFPGIVIPKATDSMEEIVDAIVQGIERSIEAAAEKAGEVWDEKVPGWIQDPTGTAEEKGKGLLDTIIEFSRKWNLRAGARRGFR